ncbi:MAG: tRNA pseudouridine(55) synthase TruB [Verrucomicrobia bacterium]|nr:tRNA pseudouridine(55) synthase TruB [Verrucomicrobiota bacterium]MBU4290671.1 tRNA pseudouridine(55) synthase TruB [Verrucomicrobiota bacterium]MBU4430365.1 tRNA pseudouridine(55) synthase TruB [Verrucomicrobiota bacterium]
MFTPSSVRPFDGILLVDKPSGLTSHDVVDRIRRQFQFDKVGHAGTLDPQATGLLVIMIGRGTKMAEFLLAGDKTYDGTLRLGVATDTQDAEGTPIREADYQQVTRQQLLNEIQRRTGDILQTPPMVSAAKRNGVPLYKLARKGQTVERQPKLIHIYEFRLLTFDPPRATFHLRCSKGVYVRTLCADIGDALGCGAHLEQLRRMHSGDFSIEHAVPLANLLQLNRTRLADLMIPLHRIRRPGQPPM